LLKAVEAGVLQISTVHPVWSTSCVKYILCEVHAYKSSLDWFPLLGLTRVTSLSCVGGLRLIVCSRADVGVCQAYAVFIALTKTLVECWRNW